LQQQLDLSARRGADWLCRANRSDGHFIPGYQPALAKTLEGDHYLRQAGAALALARAARFTSNERHLAVARQAILTLLLDTSSEPQDPTVRHTMLPSVVVNRVAAAGLLVQAIHELPAPGEDLLEQAEALCVFIGRQQRTDGSLSCTDSPDEAQPAGTDPEGITSYIGEALAGLMRSQRHRPAAWKTNVVRKALAHYHKEWKAHPSLAHAPQHATAYAEAYLLTREQPFADAVAELADWLCSLQYTQLDPLHPLWVGGMMGWADGKPEMVEPLVTSARAAEGLAAACRVAHQAGDLARYRRCRDSLERCLQFVAGLQYTEGNTQHFADWYRPVLLGGFHASHQDGNLRLDYSQHAVCALVQYLTDVAD
jgi:hypothetical protein